MKFNRNTILVILSIVAIGFLIRRTALSCYQPRPIKVEPINEDSLFDLEHKLECAPGHTKNGSTYTKSLTPGGLCKSEQLVRDQANYAIVGGIGGSLI
jgi:hypothetical protein